MNKTNYNISPETIEHYMQKGRQERSDSIFKMFIGIKHRISPFFRKINLHRAEQNNTYSTEKVAAEL